MMRRRFISQVVGAEVNASDHFSWGPSPNNSELDLCIFLHILIPWYILPHGLLGGHIAVLLVHPSYSHVPDFFSSHYI